MAWTARLVVPGLPWAAAIALGAIVAPPDAAAATAVLRQLKAPHKVFVILEGESLFNDATALLIYRLAVAAALTGTFSGWSALPMLAVVTAGSVVLGLVCSRILMVTTKWIEDVATSVIVQFIGTFAVWIVAEQLGLSGIITVVVFAIAIARVAPDLIPARIRIPSYAVWEVAVFVLNVLAFILVGLQLKPILQRLRGAELVTYATAAAAVCAAVILVRIVWVMGMRPAGGGWQGCAPGAPRCPRRYPPYRVGAVIAWCGMRGIVTIAAALALPDGGGQPAFPYRDLILFTAFCVVLGTLVVQGLTVRPLMRALRLEGDDTVETEVRHARRRPRGPASPRWAPRMERAIWSRFFGGNTRRGSGRRSRSGISRNRTAERRVWPMRWHARSRRSGGRCRSFGRAARSGTTRSIRSRRSWTGRR